MTSASEGLKRIAAIRCRSAVQVSKGILARTERLLGCCRARFVPTVEQKLDADMCLTVKIQTAADPRRQYQRWSD